jgi:hypothetical protein
MNLFEIVYEKYYLTPPSWHVFDIKVKIINYVLERMESPKKLIKKYIWKDFKPKSRHICVTQNKNFKKIEL